MMQPPAQSAASSKVLRAIDEYCERFEDTLRAGGQTRLEEILESSGGCDRALLFEFLLHVEVDFRLGLGKALSPEEYASRFPDYLPQVRRVLLGARRAEAPSQIGPYRIVGQLGAGGMGQVYKALQPQLHRFVAIKVMSGRLLHDAAARRRFERELRAAGKVSHPNLVSAFDAGEEGDSLFLVMELVEGLSLAEIARRQQSLEIADACEIIRQAAQGVAEVHRHGLIHRDIKPGNLMLGHNGCVKVLDLGLALLFERAGEDDCRDLTAAGQLMGTLDYMAPEQCIDCHHVDCRADLYGLGATLFRLLTGRVPHFDHPGTTAVGRLSAKLSAPIVPLRQLCPAAPAALERVLGRMLARSPEARPANAEEVIRELEPFCRGANLARLHSPVNEAPSEDCQVNPGPPADANLQSIPLAIAESPALAAAVSSAPWFHRPLARQLVLTVTVLILLIAIFGVARKFVERPSLHSQANSDVAAAAIPPDRPAPKPAVAPFSADRARQLQQEWADYLQVPIEWENNVGMKFCLIPAGEFLMGSSPDEVKELKLQEPDERHNRLDSELPRHRVILTQPFYIAVHEVSQRVYQEVLGANPSQFSSRDSDALAGIDTAAFPIHSVSWDDAVEFCAKLNDREQLRPVGQRDAAALTHSAETGYRLPTEAEWEFACRAGTTTKYWSGDSKEGLSRAAWTGANSDGRPHAVGEKMSNPFGLFDMHGNIWEWVHDRYEPAYYAEYQDEAAVDPDGPVADSPIRVIRGGHFSGDATVSRSAFRSYHYSSARFDDIGFRVVATVEAARQTSRDDPGNRHPDLRRSAGRTVHAATAVCRPR